MVKGDFDFSSKRKETRFVTKDMVDFEAVKTYFSNNNLSYYSFFPKSLKPVKILIRHLPINTLAQDNTECLETRALTLLGSGK